MCKNDIFFANRPQRYYFLRTQPKKNAQKRQKRAHFDRFVHRLTASNRLLNAYRKRDGGNQW